MIDDVATITSDIQDVISWCAERFGIERIHVTIVRGNGYDLSLLYMPPEEEGAAAQLDVRAEREPA